LKKNIVISISLLLILELVTGCGCKKKEIKNNDKINNEKEQIIVNTNEEVIRNQEVDGIKMTNTSLVTKNGESNLIASVTNDTNEDYYLKEYTMIFKDKQGNVIAQIPGYVGEVIKAGETKTIDSTTNYDIANAYSLEYEVKK
jgi:uncharacterized protein YcfL